MSARTLNLIGYYLALLTVGFVAGSLGPTLGNLAENTRASVNDIVAETLTLVEREIADRDILVETELDNSVPATLVDRAQLKQAFYNLVKNGFYDGARFLTLTGWVL